MMRKQHAGYENRKEKGGKKSTGTQGGKTCQYIIQVSFVLGVFLVTALEISRIAFKKKNVCSA